MERFRFEHYPINNTAGETVAYAEPSINNAKQERVTRPQIATVISTQTDMFCYRDLQFIRISIVIILVRFPAAEP